MAIMRAFWSVFFAAASFKAVAQTSSVCSQIAANISSASGVFYSGSKQYTADIYHATQRLNQNSACSVEPGTPDDVARVLSILGDTRTPFAVKSGGHTQNPGFSSTTGVQIAMTRFNQIVYHNDTNTVTIGVGQIWDQVYTTLGPKNITVVGGRNAGVGVGGLLVGGGYSWKTNQHGLSFDNLVRFELVLPTGKIVNVTDTTYPDLFFALKGGGNNFGIVTNVEMIAYPQGDVWAGSYTYGSNQIDALITAGANYYAKQTDPKAQLHLSFTSGFGGVTGGIVVFYDGPTPPAGIFDELLAIKPSGSAKTQSLASYVLSVPDTPGQRMYYESAPVVNYTAPMLRAMAEEVKQTASDMSKYGGFFATYLCEVFRPDILSHAKPIPGGKYPPSAYPARRDVALMPTLIDVLWSSASGDIGMNTMLRNASDRVMARAAALGQTAADPTSPYASKYPNYAVDGTDVERLWGPDNHKLLKTIKAQYDPNNIMDLAGGWKV